MKIKAEITTEIEITDGGRLGRGSVSIDGYEVFSCKVNGYEEAQARSLLGAMLSLVVANHVQGVSDEA